MEEMSTAKDNVLLTPPILNIDIPEINVHIVDRP